MKKGLCQSHCANCAKRGSRRPPCAPSGISDYREDTKIMKPVGNAEVCRSDRNLLRILEHCANAIVPNVLFRGPLERPERGGY